MVFLSYKGKSLPMSKLLSKVKLTFLDQASVYLKFQEMKLQKLIVSLQYQRTLHSLLLKYKQEHPTALIFYLEGLKSYMPYWLHISTTPRGNSHTFKAKSLPSLLRFKTWWRNQNWSPTHFRTFGHSSKKGGVD